MHTGELPDEEFKDGLFRIKRILLKDISQEELPLSVIMHYAWWLTDQDPGQGVEVFTRSPRMAEMDPDEIITKLERYNNEGVRTYLEYLVLSQKSDHAEYHTRLACSYVRDVANEMGDQMEELVKGFQQHVKPEATCTFVGYLGTLKPQTQLVRLRLLLIRLLLKSPLYSPETLLDTLSKAGPLDIEKAIVYGRVKKKKKKKKTCLFILICLSLLLYLFFLDG
jgi:hypothetical protein